MMNKPMRTERFEANTSPEAVASYLSKTQGYLVKGPLAVAPGARFWRGNRPDLRRIAAKARKTA